MGFESYSHVYASGHDCNDAPLFGTAALISSLGRWRCPIPERLSLSLMEVLERAQGGGVALQRIVWELA